MTTGPVRFFRIMTLMCATALRAQNLVVNGSFEADSVPVSPGYLETNPSGWTPIGGGGDILRNGYSGGSAATGTNFIDLIGGGTGTFPSGFSQSLSLTGGITYLVSFAYNGDYNTRTLDFALGSLATASLDVTLLNAFTNVGSTTAWLVYSTTLTPTTTGSYLLSFTTAAGVFGGPYVDDVSVSAIPEPATSAALFTAVALAVTAVTRRRARARSGQASFVTT